MSRNIDIIIYVALLGVFLGFFRDVGSRKWLFETENFYTLDI